MNENDSTGYFITVIIVIVIIIIIIIRDTSFI